MPTANNYYVDKALTNVSIQYTNNDISFLHDVLFPRLPVINKTGVYYEYDKANLRTENDERAPGTEANVVSYDLKKNVFGPLVDHALKIMVTDEEVQESDAALAPFIDSTIVVTEKMKLAKEKDAFTQLNAVSGGVTLSGTAQWSDYTNSTPISDIQLALDTVKLSVLRKPNTLVLGYPVYSKLIHHPTLQNLLKFTEDKLINSARLAELFDVQNVFIGDAISNTAIMGATDSLNYIWGKTAFLMYVEPNPGLRKMSAAYTLELTNGWEVGRWYDQPIHSTWIELRRFYQQLITNTNAIYPIKNAVA